MRRRDFITGLGGAALLPLAAHAQQPAMPVIGFLSGFSPSVSVDMLDSFRQGLGDTGYAEHHNVGIEYRWAEGQYDRLPAMAADLVRRHVAIIATMPTAATLAAKSATTTIPIVFTTAADPVQVGLVTSLNRPGGNITGATFYVAQLAARQLEVLHQLVPKAATVGVLTNPNAPASPRSEICKMRRIRLVYACMSSASQASATLTPLSQPWSANAPMHSLSLRMATCNVRCVIPLSRWRRVMVFRRCTRTATSSHSVG
jgi:ABC-type uncharacterized transport system substrate-binding protein